MLQIMSANLTKAQLRAFSFFQEIGVAPSRSELIRLACHAFISCRRVTSDDVLKSFRYAKYLSHEDTSWKTQARLVMNALIDDIERDPGTMTITCMNISTFYVQIIDNIMQKQKYPSRSELLRRIFTDFLVTEIVELIKILDELNVNPDITDESLGLEANNKHATTTRALGQIDMRTFRGGWEKKEDQG